MSKIDSSKQIEGAYTTMVGVTMATSRLLGRTTASAGAAEEIAVGAGLTLSAGVLSSGAGGGAMEQIAQIVTSGSQATVDFTGISGAYSSLMVKFFSRDTQGGTGAVVVRLKINNDGTSGNYTASAFDGTQNGAAINGTTAASGSGVFMGANPQDGNTAGMVGCGVITIVGYAGTTFHKRIMSQAAYEAGGAVNLVTVALSAAWKSTAAINRLTFLTDGTAFKDGSVFTLYGLSNAGAGTGEVTFSTTGNVDDLDFSNAALIRFTNASLTTLRGLKAGAPGQVVTVVSLGAGHVNLAHQDGGSTAANRLINVATSAATPLAAGAGVAILQYDGTTARWRLIDHVQGAAITATFSAGNFTASGAMTWTVDSGDVNICTYYLRGNVLELAFNIGTTTVGGTADTFLYINNGAWGSFLPAKTVSAFYAAAPSGTNQLGICQTVAADSKYYLARDLSATNWSLVTNSCYVSGTVFFNVT